MGNEWPWIYFDFFLFQINDAMGNEWPLIYFDVFISSKMMQ